MSRFRFSLASMFVCVAVVSLFLGYHVDWMRRRARLRMDVRIEQFQFTGTGKDAPGLLGWFGDHGNAYLIVRDPSPGEMKYIERMFPEANVSVDTRGETK